MTKKIVGLFLLVACGGGETTPQPTTANNTTTAPTATATASAQPNAPPAACKTLSDPIDAFSAQIDGMDAHSPDGLRKMQQLSMSVAANVDALKLTGDFVALGHDTSTQLQAAGNTFGSLASVLEKVQAAAKSIEQQSEPVTACAMPSAKAIGTMCAGKTTGDCVPVMATIDAWGKADKEHQLDALRKLKALNVTDAKLKAPYGKLVACFAPLAAGLTEIETQQARLTGIGNDAEASEKALDARFKTACGRGLFNK